MNEIIFTGEFAPLMEADLDQFEEWLHLKLPKSYRDFLLQTNGGHPHKHRLRNPYGCYIEGFYSVTRLSENISLFVQIPIMSDELPQGLIAIGYTGEGNRICLSLKKGCLYHWDHEIEYDSTRARIDELKFLANDIQELLGKLEGDEPPPPDDEIMKMTRWNDLGGLESYVSNGGDIDAVSAVGSSLVQHACYYGRLEFVAACIKSGASLKGALHAAVFSRHLDIVRLLLENNADPNDLNEQGVTPLDKLPINIYRRGGPMVELLKRHGARRSEAAGVFSPTVFDLPKEKAE